MLDYANNLIVIVQAGFLVAALCMVGLVMIKQGDLL